MRDGFSSHIAPSIKCFSHLTLAMFGMQAPTVCGYASFTLILLQCQEWRMLHFGTMLVLWNLHRWFLLHSINHPHRDVRWFKKKPLQEMDAARYQHPSTQTIVPHDRSYAFGRGLLRSWTAARSTTMFLGCARSQYWDTSCSDILILSLYQIVFHRKVSQYKWSFLMAKAFFLQVLLHTGDNIAWMWVDSLD